MILRLLTDDGCLIKTYHVSWNKPSEQRDEDEWDVSRGIAWNDITTQLHDAIQDEQIREYLYERREDDEAQEWQKLMQDGECTYKRDW
jgi:hypothetical protein